MPDRLISELCSACTALLYPELETPVNQSQDGFHHSSLQFLRQATEQGCAICTIDQKYQPSLPWMTLEDVEAEDEDSETATSSLRRWPLSLTVRNATFLTKRTGTGVF
jgi:hypothetical protein